MAHARHSRWIAGWQDAAVWGAVAAAFALTAAAPSAGQAGEAARSESLAGRLLVAAPSMPDGRFAETVIYMLRHDDTGAMGVVVNRPMGDVPAATLLGSLGLDEGGAEGSIRVHYGGPVENERGFVLHSTDYLDGDSLTVAGGLALSMNSDVVRAIAAGEGPRHSLLLFGYAGWGPGQLESEMMRDDWITVPADEALVFDGEYREKWRRAIDRRGVDL